MFKFGRRLRVAMVAVLAAVIGMYPVYAGAATAIVLHEADEPAVFITEFQTNGGTAAQEFIELYNQTDKAIVFSDPAVTGLPVWKIQFFNSTSVKAGTPVWETATTASNSITLTGTIEAHGYYLLSSTDYKPAGTDADQYYGATSSHLMTDTGGGLQLLRTGPDPTTFDVHDRVMWLKSTDPAVLPSGVLAGPGSGKSLQRIPDPNEEYVGPDGFLTSYGSEDLVTPLAAWQPPVPEVPVEPEESPGGSDTEAGESETAAPAENVGLAPPQVTELLPNPASPMTDANDEFIELYNPNNAAFNLKGYSLQVGTTTKHSYLFADDTVLPALGYQAFYSADTKLSLANTGGQARLLDPAGLVTSETTAYTSAANGESWILSGNTWQWTTSSTPALANILTIPAVTAKAPAAKTSAAKTTTAKVAAAKKTTKAAAAKTTKAKAKTTKAKKAKTTKKKTDKKPSALSAAAITKAKPPIHTGILVAVAVVAVLYGLYEYRHDIANKFRRVRENRTARRLTGGADAWRRGYSTD